MTCSARRKGISPCAERDRCARYRAVVTVAEVAWPGARRVRSGPPGNQPPKVGDSTVPDPRSDASTKRGKPSDATYLSRRGL
jgi:hypothetical protein